MKNNLPTNTGNIVVFIFQGQIFFFADDIALRVVVSFEERNEVGLFFAQGVLIIDGLGEGNPPLILLKSIVRCTYLNIDCDFVGFCNVSSISFGGNCRFVGNCVEHFCFNVVNVDHLLYVSIADMCLHISYISRLKPVVNKGFGIIMVEAVEVDDAVC